MESLNYGQRENKPLMAYFLQPYPLDIYSADEESVFNPVLNINETLQGAPLFMAPRASKPPTSCSTPGHTIKAGYTPSGKWRPSKYVPSQTDKRAGK
jgi:hypothetical protein